MVIDSAGRYFNDLFYESAIPMFVLDPETGKIIDTNQAAAKFYGWKRV